LHFGGWFVFYHFIKGKSYQLQHFMLQIFSIKA